jgi:hypothetical protein
VLPDFFRKLVELDPQVVSDAPQLDIGMREAARVVADWVDIQQSPLRRQTIADAARNAKAVPEESRAASSAPAVK